MKNLISLEEKHNMFFENEAEDLYQYIYLKDVEPYLFKDEDNASARYFDFLCDAANLLDVSPHNVMIAGSSRLGFSLNPSEKKKRFLNDFYEDSDIDLVVVSPHLFEFFMREFTRASYRIGHVTKKKELGRKLLKGFFDFYHFTDLNQIYIDWTKKTGSFQRDLQKKFDIQYEINYRVFNDWLSVELYYTNSLINAKDLIMKQEGKS